MLRKGIKRLSGYLEQRQSWRTLCLSISIIGNWRIAKTLKYKGRNLSRFFLLEEKRRLAELIKFNEKNCTDQFKIPCTVILVLQHIFYHWDTLAPSVSLSKNGKKIKLQLLKHILKNSGKVQLGFHKKGTSYTRTSVREDNYSSVRSEIPVASS